MLKYNHRGRPAWLVAVQSFWFHDKLHVEEKGGKEDWRREGRVHGGNPLKRVVPPTRFPNFFVLLSGPFGAKGRLMEAMG